MNTTDNGSFHSSSQSNPADESVDLTRLALILADVESIPDLFELFWQWELIPLPYERVVHTTFSSMLYTSDLKEAPSLECRQRVLYDVGSSDRTMALGKDNDHFLSFDMSIASLGVRGLGASAHSIREPELEVFSEDLLLKDTDIFSFVVVPNISGGTIHGVTTIGHSSHYYEERDVRALEKIFKLYYSTYHRIRVTNRFQSFPAPDVAKSTPEMSDRRHQEVLLNLGFMQSLIDNVESVVFVKGLDGRYLLINKRFELIFGKSADEILGRDDFQVFSAEAADAFQVIDKEVARTGQVIRCEEIAPQKDGPHTYISVKFPVYDEFGEIIAIGGVATDITHLKSIERELRDTNIFLDSIIEHIPSMIFVKEAKEHRFVRLNRYAEELLGYTREELLGKNDYDFFPYEQAHSFISKDKEVLEKFKYVDIPEEPIDTKSGERLILHTRKISIPDFEGNPAFLLGISEDVTKQIEAREVLRDHHKKLEQMVSERTKELERLNQELRTHADERDRVNQFIRKSLKEKELLLKEIHHRVKNNMQVISSLLKLQGRHIVDEEARALCAQSEQRVRSMALIHERLYLSEGLAEIQLRSYILELSKSLYRSYAINAQRVKLETDLEDVTLGIDQAIPCGLLLNEFISNALKHAFIPEDGGTLRITLKEVDGTILLGFSDNGCGLPAHFDIDKQETLGFEIIRTLASQLEASIDVNTNKPTEFRISFVKSLR